MGTGDGQSEGRSITSGADLSADVLAALRYDLTLTGPGGEVIERTLSGGKSIKITAALGEWRIAAKAYQSDSETVAGTGTLVFTVLPGLNTVRIPMIMAGPCYTITVPGIANGTIAAGFSAAFPGTVVTLRVKPEEGYRLASGALTYNYGGKEEIPEGSGLDYHFTMPASDVTVNVEFADYAIRYARAGGTGDGTSWKNASDDVQKMMDELAVLSMNDAGTTGPYIVKLGAGTYAPRWEPAVPASPGGYSYTPPGDLRNAAFTLREGVQVWGGYPASGGDDASRNTAANVTTLSGDFNGDDTVTGSGETLTITNNAENAYHVVLGLNIPAKSGTVLDGLTISGGYADGPGSITVNGVSVSRTYGGGMYYNNSSPVLTNVTISGNRANGMGGGICNENASPVLTDVTISGNYAGNTGGGMFNFAAASPELTNVTISGNYTINTGGGISNWNALAGLADVTISGNYAVNKGGGIYNDTSSLLVTGGEISGNKAKSGGGIYHGDSSLILSNVRISGNTAVEGAGGGIESRNSSPILTNVIISGNKASGIGGGGIFIDNSSPVLTNVTISGNTAVNDSGGGIYNNSPSIPTQIRNSVIWGNTAGSNPGIHNDNGSTTAITYSIVQDSTDTGNGNKTVGSGAADSPFSGWKDPASTPMPNSDGDYRLKAGSPAINAGDNDLYPANTGDAIFAGITLTDAAKAAINAALSKDLEGNPRMRGTAIDMGAYEKE
jgi:hypothetical protein